MKSKAPQKTKLFIAFSLVLTLANGDGFRNPPAGANAQARFGGNIANTPDASAVTRNPANLIDFDENATMATLTFGYSKMDFTNVAGQKLSSEEPWAILPGLFMVIPTAEDENLAFGLGITSPYGRSTSLSDDTSLAYLAPYYTQLSSVEITPAFSTRVNEKISLGLSLNILYSELDLRQKYPWSLAAGVPGLPDGSTLFDGKGTGIGATAAVTIKATERQRIALTVRSPIQVDYSGELEVTNIPPGAPAAPVSDFETEMTFPLVIALAYSLQVNERWLIETNLDWAQQSAFDQLEIDAGVNTPLLPSDTIPMNWDDNFTLGISACYTLNPEWELRAGYIYLESPVPSSTMLPTAAEQDQGVIAIGAGYSPGGNHHFDFAYSVGLFSGRTVSDNPNPVLNGDYDFEAHLLTVNYGYHF
ncbi:outer membrane protein transport protein [Kiritimatiellaeota bacterium B1221]|nr:outer membrane protein transport protein [Kiritimatiellaeota bacterium B1221]